MRVLKKQANIATHFPEHIFWDTDVSKLSIKRDKDFIIPRAMHFTSENTFDDDFKRLEKLYSKMEILESLEKADSITIPNIALELASEKLDSELI